MAPQELKEWLHWATQLETDRLYFRREFAQLASTLPQMTVDALGEFYDRASRDGGIQRLNEWLQRVSASPMGVDEKGVRNLLRLFGHLGQHGYKPFTSHAFRRHHPPMADWTKLPATYQFLAAPAMKVHGLLNPSDGSGGAGLPPNVSADESSELADVAMRLRSAGWPGLKAWISDLGVQEHREVSMVVSLVHALDALGFPYA